MKSHEPADFVRHLPAAFLGGIVVGEAAINLGVSHPVAEILAIGGAFLGAALQHGAEHLADRMSSPKE